MNSYDDLFIPIDEWNELDFDKVIEQYVTAETFCDLQQKYNNYFKPRFHAIKYYVPAAAFNDNQLLYLKTEYDIIPQDIPTYTDKRIHAQGENTWSKLNEELYKLERTPLINDHFMKFYNSLEDQNLYRALKAWKKEIIGNLRAWQHML